MKLSSTIITALSVGTAIYAAPTEKRTTTLVSVIGSSLNAISSLITNSQNTITQAAASIAGSVTGTLSVVITLQTNFGAIARALTAASTQVVGQTTGAVGGIAGQVALLTQSEVNALATDFQIVGNILSGISISVTATVTNLAPSVLNSVRSEINAVLAAIVGLLNPLIALYNAIITAQGSLGVSVTGLQNAASGVNTILATQFSTLGISF